MNTTTATCRIRIASAAQPYGAPARISAGVRPGWTRILTNRREPTAFRRLHDGLRFASSFLEFHEPRMIDVRSILESRREQSRKARMVINRRAIIGTRLGARWIVCHFLQGVRSLSCRPVAHWRSRDIHHFSGEFDAHLPFTTRNGHCRNALASLKSVWADVGARIPWGSSFHAKLAFQLTFQPRLT